MNNIQKLSTTTIKFIKQSQRFNKRGFFTILNQYERGVVFNLGKFHKVKEPGFRVVIPFFQTCNVVDVRTFTYTLDKQEIISKDNISLIVDAIVFFKIHDPELVVTKVGDCTTLVKEMAQIKIRELLSHNTLDQVLHNRDKFSNEIYDELKDALDGYGITVDRLNLKDIRFEESIVRAMAKRAEADQLREAKIIYAQSEVQTARQILEAARILEQSPIAVRLRELDALQQIAKEPSKTIVYTPSNAFDSIPKVPIQH
ncbi:hypothetical protein RB653_008158 [Dictyostelium firmibasis]|uniref:Band 7 domain-containing protein n=1 Tax=Dictyostelium firmibasis TaxID=79012 RepID=A0AAN7TYE8_9MYCE